MLKTVVWPKIRSQVNSKDITFQQDGAPPHWRTEVLPSSKFGDNIISNKTALPLPSNSPDLSPLDYWFWSAAMAEVRRVQSKTLEELKLCVENYAKSLSKEQVNKAVTNIFKRARWCVNKKGGSFESQLKKCNYHGDF